MKKNEPNISIYDADGGIEEFPVLKAFQQYIDAEQAKARRRLIIVSSIFGVVLVLVIVVFSILLLNSAEHKQELNDRIANYSREERDRVAEFAKASALKEAEVRSMTETLQRLQRQLDDQERKANEAAAEAARELAQAKTELSNEETAALNKRQSEMTAKLQKAITLLKAEKAKISAEKERLRQEELERYRREHYPKFYSKDSNGKPINNAAMLDEIEEALDEDDGDEDEVVEGQPAMSSDISGTSVEYFSDEGSSATIPVEIKGKSAGWRVPVE